MLTISKPTLFSHDGLAVRGQCNHDAPGWLLRWFDKDTPPTAIWQGAFKTCRHLQISCRAAGSLEEAKTMLDNLLNANTLAHRSTQPTDAYPSADAPPEKTSDDDGANPSGHGKKKRKKRRH